MFATPSTPNLTDFYIYVTDQGVPSSDLPSNSDYLSYALNYAQEVALGIDTGVGPVISGTAGPYVMAVYNLGLHQLLKITPDQQGMTFFDDKRAEYNLTSLKSGVVLASADQATSQTLVVPEFFTNLTLSQLDLLKTPYGRMYLEYSQLYGQSIVDYS